MFDNALATLPAIAVRCAGLIENSAEVQPLPGAKDTASVDATSVGPVGLQALHGRPNIAFDIETTDLVLAMEQDAKRCQVERCLPVLL